VARRTNTEVAGLALVAYLPFLLSSSGRVSADSKQALFLDPEGLLGQAPDLWDPSVGAGTVPHQLLGYLVPTGPWFWLFEQLGAPDWVAQRLWWGTLSFLAALGARWLFRLLGVDGWAAVAGALVYACTPYQLAFTARISVLLLPWAALPWLVGLAARATRERGWRWPALLALVLFAVGGVNASSLVLVAIGPVLWLVGEALGGAARARAALAAGARTGLLALGVSAWWLVGVRLQGAYGLPVLQLTENLETVARASLPGDVLRGLGNWFFYGRDRTGYSLDQADDYASDALVVAVTYAVPVLALAAVVVLRWAHRAYFALLVVVGTIVAVGSWPFEDPSPYGRAWRAFTTDTSLGLALRNSPRAVPLVALGLGGLLAATVAGIRPGRWRRTGEVGLVALALATLLPVWQEGYLTEGMARPEEIPDHWEQATAALDEGGAATRVLEVPGTSFAAYDWGTTVDPITPILIDRPYLDREVLPDGTPPSVNLLAALDRRMQLGTFEPRSLAPVARLLGVGTVSLRADLDRSGRFDAPAVEPLWDALNGEDAEGLADPVGFGPPGGAGGDASLPSVALFDVDDPLPIVRTAPVDGPIVLAGDGDGVVDAAAAGLLDGRALVLYGTALDDRGLDGALDAGAHLVLTDSHRRRIETWFYSIKDTRGPTEREGEVQPDPTGYDFRLEPFPGASDDSRTVAVHVGGRAEATMAGGPERPEERAVHAADGDPATSWRVGGDDPRGTSITVTPDRPLRADELRLVQAPTATGRRIARVEIRVPGEEAVQVDLGPASLEPAGQAVALPGRDVARVTIEILDTSPPAQPFGDGTPVGFAEIGLADLAVEETLRLPVDLLERVGPRLRDHALDVVLTRLVAGTERQGRPDEEPRLDRTFELPVARTFALVGDLAVAPAGSGPACRRDLLEVDGTPVPVRVVRAGQGIEGCEPVALGAGAHRVRARHAAGDPLALDRVVLSSSRSGTPASVAARGRPLDGAPAVEVRVDEPGHVAVEVEPAGASFWLVVGQSWNEGWELSVEGGSVGDHQVVNGYANGWIVTPDGDGPVVATARWTPQRLVPVGLVVSVAAVALCGVVAWRTRRRLVPSLAAAPDLSLGLHAVRVPLATAFGLVAAVAALGLAVASPPVAVVAGIATFGLARWPATRLAVLVLSPLALAASRFDERPQLAWLAVAFTVAVVATDAARPLSRRGSSPPG
jgi:arabinofuranan 3-O-arabinosyltransferase